MSFSIMPCFVQVIHVVRLARGPNAQPTGSQQHRKTAVRLHDVDGRDNPWDNPGHDGGGRKCHVTRFV
jgi:hypothetical protein